MNKKIFVSVAGINGIPARHGGFETCVDNVAVRHAESGLGVTVYCRSRNIKTSGNCYSGVKLVKLPSIGHKSLETLSHTFLSVIHLLFQKKDLVHIYGVGNSVFMPFLKLLGIKIVISVDSLDWEREKWGRFAKWFLFNSAKIAVRFSDAVIVDSKVVQEYYSRVLNAATIYIPYGAELGRNCDEKVLKKYNLVKENYVLFVGRLIPEKGVHRLIEAFAKLNTDKYLVIIGGDWFSTEYIEMLKRKAEGKKIRFLGFVYGDECRAIYSGAYIYIQPSEVDGTSPSLLTAMGTGNCVLVNSIKENLETIGDGGHSYKCNDADSLAEQLQYLLSDKNVVDEYRQKAVERIKSVYSWDRVADAIAMVYDDITAGRKPRVDIYEKP